MGRKYDIPTLINSILGSLVSITASCAVCRPWESFVIGGIGAALATAGAHLVDWIKVDDPVGAVAVHGIAGIWGMISVGLFVDIDRVENMTLGQRGLFHGGGFYLMGVQVLASVCIIIWSATWTLVILLTLKRTIGIRMTSEEERLGADIVEHGIHKETLLNNSRHLLNHRPSRHSRSLSQHSVPDTRVLSPDGSTLFIVRKPSVKTDSKPSPIMSLQDVT